MELKFKRQGMIKKIILIMLIPCGLILFYGTSYTPDLIEKYYSQFIGKKFIQVLSYISGILPISFMEFLVIGLILYILYKLYSFVYSLIKNKGKRKKVVADFMKEVFIKVSIIYFIFVAGWSLNYNRYPFSKIAGYDTHSVNIEELSQVCESLINQTNELRLKVKEDGNGVMYLSDGKKNALNAAQNGYDVLMKQYPELNGSYGTPKGVLFSKFMSLQGLGGIYCPFTGEANINMDMPDSSIPFVICHEMAHQRGFAREDEANFIGYLASINNPRIDFKYSGSISALNYAMNALYEHDKAKFKILRGKFSDELNRDFKARSVYWQGYEGVVNKVSNAANNTYLKVNRQKDGVESYGRMVDLLIYQYRQNKLLNNSK